MFDDGQDEVESNLYNFMMKEYQPIYCVPEIAIYIDILTEEFVNRDIPRFPVDKKNGMFLTNRKILKEIIKIYSIDRHAFSKIKDDDGHTHSIIDTTNELFKFITESVPQKNEDTYIEVKNLLAYIENFIISHYVASTDVLIPHLDQLIQYTKEIKIFRYDLGQGTIYKTNIDYDRIVSSWNLDEKRIKMVNMLQILENKDNGLIQN